MNGCKNGIQALISFYNKLSQAMKKLTLQIDNMVFDETEKIVSQIKKSREWYITEAIGYYNRLQKKLISDQEKLKSIQTR